MIFDEIRRKPWNSHEFSIPPWLQKYPTMLTPEELRMLVWIAQKIDVEGEIVDLGAFLGGSSSALALGVARSRASRTVHSYDRFAISEELKYKFIYSKGHKYIEGLDSLQIFKEFTKPVSPYININMGNILDQKWSKADISILFVDISKSTQINDYLLENFFKHLKVGSVIIQQDFLFRRCPWLHTTMYRLREKAPLLSFTEENSAIFGVTDALTEADIANCLSDKITNQDRLTAAEYFRDLFPYTRQRESMESLIAAITASPDAAAARYIKKGRGASVKKAL
jgi:hypothetical protein